MCHGGYSNRSKGTTIAGSTYSHPMRNMFEACPASAALGRPKAKQEDPIAKAVNKALPEQSR